MAYIKKTYETGNVIEIYKVHNVRFQSKKKKPMPRAPKEKETPEAQKRINEKHAMAKLRRIINKNFKYGDAHVVLGYLPGNRPNDKTEAKTNVEKFLRKLRGLYKKSGAELKYICVSEYGQKTIHHHLVISEANKNIDLIIEAWTHGRPQLFPLDKSGQYENLANYLVKETSATFNDPERKIHAKRWCASANLERPVAEVEKVRADSWREYPKPLEGYYIDKVFTGFNPITGYPYQFCSMVKIFSKEKVKGRGSINEDDSNHQFKRRGG